MASPEVTLYVIPASHPCAAVEAALRLKAIPFRRRVLLPLSQALAGPLLFGGATVPGMRLDERTARNSLRSHPRTGQRIAGSRAIMRRLDALQSEPPLLPEPGSPAYARVLEAERWGDEMLQAVPRRIIDAAFVRRPESMESYAGEERLLLPRPLLRPALPLTARLMALKNHAGDQNARADIAALPAQLQRIDGWIDEGLLGGERPNAADLQIGSSIRLLLSIGDVRGLVEAHRAAALADWFPPLAGSVPAGVLPPEWLAAAA
jgi:glutathione S-transferase